MKCEFSETQFLFGALHEISNKLSPSKGWDTPIIPTQADEKLLGYDCKLEKGVKAICFQFKVPTKLIRNNAKYWSYFGGEYFMFKIWPDSLTPQHNTLVNLANKSKGCGVFYCSPDFIKQSEFSLFYKKGEIAKNSTYISCKNLPTISGDDNHDISYMINPRRFIMHSDTFEITGMDYDGFISNIKEIKPYTSLEECVSELSEDLKINVGYNKSLQEKLQLIAQYLFFNLNIQLMLV